MDFPSWLPKPIGEYIKNLVLGDDSQQDGLMKAQETATIRGDLQSAQQFESEIRTLQLLAGVEDDRIREAYAILANEFRQDMQWRGFAAAAWAAKMDFNKHRQRLLKAQLHATAIEQAATELARLLDSAGRLYDRWPGELYSLRTLLAGTDGADPLWPGLRSHILGDETTDADYSIRYIWGRTAPSVSDCLKTIVAAVHKFQPTEQGIVGAAVNRQSNPKTEYIRAFGSALDERQIATSIGVIKAMAVAASVVLDDPDIDVSFQDVRQTLKVWRNNSGG